MPAVPIVMGAVSAYSAIKNAKAAGQQNALMRQAQQNQAGALEKGQAAGQSMLSMGMPATSSALNYWGTMLHGNRAAMGLATAAPRAQITDQYRGAMAGLEHAGVRGGEAATAKAELIRDQAAKVAGLTAGVQPMAAGEVGAMGQNLVSGGTSAMMNAATGYGGAATTAGNQASQFAAGERADLGGVGTSMGELVNWWKNRNQGKTPSYNPSWTMTTPDYANPSDAGGYG